MSERPPPPPRTRATTLGRPAVPSSQVVSMPRSWHHEAMERAMVPSPGAPATSEGLTESIDDERAHQRQQVVVHVGGV
jgi:hypothetical protein